MSSNRIPKRPTVIRRLPLDNDTRVLIEATIDELIRVAAGAGLSVRDLNRLLDSGLGLEELVECVAARLYKRAA